VRTASGKAFSIRFLTKATRTDIAKKSINKKCSFALERNLLAAFQILQAIALKKVHFVATDINK